jgi:hypothetical protein
VSRLPRTVCDGCGRAMARRRGQFAGPSVSGHTDACTHVGVGGRWDRFSSIEKRRRELSRLPRTVCESVGERWRDGAGSLPDLRYPVTPMLAHMLARAVDGTDFRASRSGGGSERGCRAQPARVWESDGATARAVCRTLGIRSHRCLHTCWRGRSMGQIFEHREAVTGVSRLPRTVCESVGERWRDGAGSLPTLGIRVTQDACTHVGLVGDDRFSTIEKRRWGCAAGRAQPRECRQTRLRDGAGSLPTLGLSGHTTDDRRTCWRGRSMGQISTIEKR